MCGIVGAIAERNVVPILMEGLRRLEYRGYDSAGIAVLNGTSKLKRLRTVGKVKVLQDAIDADPTYGPVGIAHTRWATHGVPSERNAHPHISHDGLAIVHNGIIENHEELREELKKAGYKFTSETDTEVIAHRVHFHLAAQKDLFKAVRATVAELEGAYALAVVSEEEPERIILADSRQDGTYRVMVNYQQDCASLPTDLLAGILGISVEVLIRPTVGEKAARP